MNKNIFITNETARKDPAVIAAMASILKSMTAERDRKAAGIAPHTVEVSPVNFLQDVMWYKKFEFVKYTIQNTKRTHLLKTNKQSLSFGLHS